MAEVTITKDNFETEVLKSDKPVLVDFWASWCGPCQKLAPIVSEIAEEFPEYKICKVNVDEQMELATTYNVMSIPFVAVFKNGFLVNSTIGYQSKESLVALLK